MQGQRGSIGSFQESINFEPGSSSSNAAVDRQIFWSNMWNQVESRVNLRTPSDVNFEYFNSLNHEEQSFNRRRYADPSSSNTQNHVSQDEQISELGCSSSLTHAGAGLALFDQHGEPTYNLSLDDVNTNLMFMRDSNSNSVPNNDNSDSGSLRYGGNSSQGTECPNIDHYDEAEDSQNASASGTQPTAHPSENIGVSVEGNSCRPGSSLDGQRASCKRKSPEGNAVQSSVSGSSSCSHHAESSEGRAFSVCYGTSTSLSISSETDELDHSLGPPVRELSSQNLPDSSMADRSRRNFRVRINPTNQQDSISHDFFSTGSAVRQSAVSLPQLSQRLPFERPLDLRSEPVVDDLSTQAQPVTIPAPSALQDVQSFPSNAGYSSETGRLSSSAGDRHAVSLGEGSSRSMSRSAGDHRLFVPARASELRSLIRNTTRRSLGGESSSISGSASAASQAGSSSGHPPAAPWVSQDNPSPHYSRRLSEYVRRQLFSSTGFDSGGQTNAYSSLHSDPSSSHDMVLPSTSGNRSQLHPRSAPWMDRHGGLGLPYSLRSLAVVGEGSGSNMLVSEIRNVLGLMRRGGFEDVMILDQSVFSGVADLHDRHRDMRLDVDNMSYEELLALEERIGNVSTGLSEEKISTCLKKRKFSPVESEMETEAKPCCICQEEYKDGEDLGTLDCGHDFHSECIKEWLTQKNLCPICKTTALDT